MKRTSHDIGTLRPNAICDVIISDFDDLYNSVGKNAVAKLCTFFGLKNNTKI